MGEQQLSDLEQQPDLLGCTQQSIELSAEVPLEALGQRLDAAAAQLFPDYSRGRLQSWIKTGELRVNGESGQAKQKLRGGELLSLAAQLEEQGDWQAEPMDLEVVYEDDSLIVINKPAGLVVHPAVGNRSGTLLNGLLFRYPELVQVPRAGIVHRLDKDTTGLMVVARTLTAQASLVGQLQARTVSRQYEAVVVGEPTAGGSIDEPIGRHPKQRKLMAVVANGKPAISHFSILQRFPGYTHLAVKLETGRTHQIRVHMAHKRWPLVGDATYGGRARPFKGCPPVLAQAIASFPRQALHARELALLHPVTEQLMHWQVDRPKDLQQLLDAFKAGV